jgi:SSS family transporter
MLYLAGGQSSTDLSSAMNNFWRLDLSQTESESLVWEILPAWPGPPRAFNITISQHNGYNECIYVLTGRNQDEKNRWNVLTDMYMYDPVAYARGKDPWSIKAPLAGSRMAGTAITIGQSHFCIISGADGSLYQNSDALKESHPGFPSTALAYNTITNEWFSMGEIPQNQLTTHAIQLDERALLVSGEIKPRIRSPKIWTVMPIKSATFFGTIDLIAVVFYLLILVGIGVYFAGRTSTTDDFFRGSQNIPWWAAGCSIFATMLSSITFMSVPAKTYATDWLYFIINLMILAVAPFIIYYILPFFRKINLTSAYEYLELRFNLACRLFASACYILFQLGRMAIVLFLPALALASVSPISVETSILAMGILSIIYCTLGGIQAVIWTDTLQTFVLLGGAGLSLLIILLSPSVDVTSVMDTGILNEKVKIIDWQWSYTEAVAWIVIIGGIGQALVPYASDQGVIQRYMSVSSRKNAEKSIWLNAALSTLATLLFFSLGTALFLYYKTHPEDLDPTYPIDAVFPLFIAQKLPAGIAGLVIAGIFAAAQSTVSTSMNSISTAFITDFFRRFDVFRSEHIYLRSARVITIVAGSIGVGLALLIANANVKSIWDLFIGVLGLFGGSICGLFLLGMFTTKANGTSALVGAFIGAGFLWFLQQNSQISFLLYASIGLLSTFCIGWIGGWVSQTDDKDLNALTVFTFSQKDSHEVSDRIR